MDWLSEIEKDDYDARERHPQMNSHETRTERMARVLRELGNVAYLVNKGTQSRLYSARDNLSEDAKELCVAANESSRERIDAGENNGKE